MLNKGNVRRGFVRLLKRAKLWTASMTSPREQMVAKW